MLFVAIGVLVGPLLLDEINAAPKSSMMRTLAEATLALVLFCDASRIDGRTLRRESKIPVRLLGVGLPLTIALGSLLAAVLFGHLSVSEAVIVGVILARPTRVLGRRSLPTAGFHSAYGNRSMSRAASTTVFASRCC